MSELTRPERERLAAIELAIHAISEEIAWQSTPQVTDADLLQALGPVPANEVADTLLRVTARFKDLLGFRL